MELKPHALGITSASIMGISYIVCASIFALFPNSALNFFNYFFHGIDLKKISAVNLAWGNFFTGLVLTLVSSYLLGFLFGVVYNKVAK